MGASVSRANRHRGEVEAEIGGQRRILCLTLGALAELETAFAADNLAELAQRFASGRLKAGDMIAIIGAGLRGGGNLVSDEDVATMTLDQGLPGCAQLVSELLTATFAPQTEQKRATPPNPRMPQQQSPSPGIR